MIARRVLAPKLITSSSDVAYAARLSTHEMKNIKKLFLNSEYFSIISPGLAEKP